MQKWLNRIQPSESGIQGGAAILVGLLSGAGVWLFKQLIDLFQQGAFGWLGSKLAIFWGWTIVLNSSCYLEFKGTPHPKFDDFSSDCLAPLPLGEGRVRVFARERRTSLEGSNLG